nr:hypothetical protein Iba_chr03bCG1880 [Ipomoea batatas]
MSGSMDAREAQFHAHQYDSLHRACREEKYRILFQTVSIRCMYHGVYEHTLLFLLFDFEWYALIVGLKKQLQIGNVKGMVEEKEASDPQILEVKVRPEKLKLDDGIKNIKMCHQKMDAFGEDGANNMGWDAIFVPENPTNTCNELSPENSNTYPTSKLFMEYIFVERSQVFPTTDIRLSIHA